MSEAWYAVYMRKGSYNEARGFRIRALTFFNDLTAKSDSFLSSSTLKVLQQIYRNAAWKTADWNTRRLFNLHRLRLFNTGDFDFELANELTYMIWDSAMKISKKSIPENVLEIEIEEELEEEIVRNIMFTPELGTLLQMNKVW